MENVKNIGIWIRVSTEDQAKGESPEHHLVRAKTYAQMKGWNIIEIYDLSGVSGKSVIEHSEAKRMMKDLKSKRIDGLIFSKLARLARNTKELLDFSDFFQTNNGALISLQESIDTSTPAGRFFYSMLAAMAQWEREEIVDRVKASVTVRAKLGKSLGGAAPFGYTWDDKHLQINEKEAVVRRLMFELFLKYKRKAKVASELNKLGYRTRSKSTWSDNSVSRLLEDPIAKGMRRSNYTTSTGDGKHWVLKKENEWIFTEAPAIVDEETWNAVNNILSAQKEKGKRPAKTTVHLFTGIVHCSCGSKMYKPSNNKKYVCYNKQCRNKILIDDLETIFHEQLKNYVYNDQILENMNARTINRATEIEQQIAVQIIEKKKLEKEIEQIFSLHRDGQIPTEAFKSHHEPLYNQLESLKQNLPALEAERDYLRMENAGTAQAISDAQTLYKEWPKLSSMDKKLLIEAICSHIAVSKDEVEISLTHISPSHKLMTDSRHNSRDSYLPPA